MTQQPSSDDPIDNQVSQSIEPGDINQSRVPGELILARAIQDVAMTVGEGIQGGHLSLSYPVEPLKSLPEWATNMVRAHDRNDLEAASRWALQISATLIVYRAGALLSIQESGPDV